MLEENYDLDEEPWKDREFLEHFNMHYSLMLQERFMEIFDKTIRDAIKLLADKFICHYDSFDENISNVNNEFRWAERIEKQLRSPYEGHNLDYIMETLISCIGDSSIIKVNFESEE